MTKPKSNVTQSQLSLVSIAYWTIYLHKILEESFFLHMWYK